jgi:hypothetical protein
MTNLEGRIVVLPGGRFGLANRLNVLTGCYEAQFGADGPFSQIPACALRAATADEIKQLKEIGATVASVATRGPPGKPRGRPRKIFTGPA